MHDYDHYIALDWAQSNMAIAKLTRKSDKISVIDVPANINELKLYLDKTRGRKILTFEETTTAHWLYTELISHVDEILVCDPHRNKLLLEGPKTDKIDAVKMVKLLKANLLKPVFHSGSLFFNLRKLVSSYDDLIQRGVRLKNQKSAIFRAIGINKSTGELNNHYDAFVLSGINKAIDAYEEEKKKYEKEFSKLCKNNKLIKNLKSIPGIGEIHAVKLAAIVIDAKRFKNKSAWLSYCGLINLEKISGGRSYGKKRPRYNRTMKSIFKIAALAVINENSPNPFRDYYESLITNKGITTYNARHAVARRVAVVTFGIFKSNKKFRDYWRIKEDKAA